MPFSLTVNGSPIDRVATRVGLGRLRPFDKDGFPTLTLHRRGITPAAPPDPFMHKPATLTSPGGVLVFAGDVEDYLDHHQSGLGWVREYTAYGLRRRADYIPVTDSNTGTDTARYNMAADDPDAIPSRQGRTVGQIVADVLGMSANSAALAAAGVGGYTSAGTGARASAVLSGHGVASVSVTAGGAGWAAAPAVLFSGGGGSGATGTASVSGGAVTGVTVTSAGSGYNSPPVVILSRLPLVTLTDLDALSIIPPYEVQVIGERILSALEAVVQNVHPNHFVHVRPDGVIRFLDPRAFTPMTLTRGADPRVGLPQLRRDVSACYSRVLVRGFTRVVPVLVGTKPLPGSTRADNGLQEDFAHDGLTNTQAKAAWTPADFQDPGQPNGTATATAAVSSGAVTTVSPGSQGYGYTSAPPVTLVGVGTGATATATLTGDKVTGYTVTAGGTGYTGPPTVVVGPPGGVGQYDQGSCACPNTTTVRVTSSNGTFKWSADYWDQTDAGHHGVVVVSSDVVTGVSQNFSARVIANTALSPGGTSDLTLDTPLPSTNYGSYQLFGTSGGASVVWRRYKVVDAATGAAMQPHFPYPVAFRNSDGTAATLTSSPKATVFHSRVGNGTAPFQGTPVGFTIDPASSHVLLNIPSAMVYTTDGKTPVIPDDVQAFLAVANGTLQAVYPPDSGGLPQYAGTSYTVDGVQRTKVFTVNDWRDYSNQDNMDLYAFEAHGALSDAVIEGTIPYFGLLPALLAPGVKLNVAASDYTTGYEAINAPVVAVDLEFNEGGQPTLYVMSLHVSTRRAPYSGAAFRRPSQTGRDAISGFQGDFSLAGFSGSENAGWQGAVAGAANFGANTLNAAAEAANNVPRTPADLGIPTDFRAFMPSAEDFAAFGFDTSMFM